MDLYRYQLDLDPYEYGWTVILKTFKVIKETECYRFINIGDGKIKKCKIDAKSSYAYESKERAKTNCIKRTIKRIEYLKSDIRKCEKGLKLIEDPTIK